MKRKIIQVAGSTHVVSLPKTWLKKNELKKGDDVEIEEKGNMVELKAEAGKNHLSLDVDISALTPFLADRFMARAYQKGYDEIILHFDHPDILQAVRRKVPELKGFVVMKITENSCTIKSIPITDIDFETSLRRAFEIIKEMAEMCKTGYESQDNELLKTIIFRDIAVNKFCYFCLRSLNKGDYDAGLGQTMLYYHVERLEDLGDEFKFLADVLQRAPLKNAVLMDLINLTIELLDKVHTFFYNPSRKSAVESIRLYKEMNSIIDSNTGEQDGEIVKALFIFKMIARILYHYPTMRLDTLAKIKNGE